MFETGEMVYLLQVYKRRYLNGVNWSIYPWLFCSFSFVELSSFTKISETNVLIVIS